MRRYIRLLTIAGSDSGGGAGIQADLKTFGALGAYGLSVVTVLTAQNTQTVTAVYPVSAQFVGEQLDVVLSDIGADAVKIGMLYDVDIIHVVAEKLAIYAPRHIVLDPVMVAKGGARLITDAAVLALQNQLFPHVFLITPNIPEAEVLLGQRITTKDDMAQAALLLAQKYQLNVLIKGGHLSSRTPSSPTLLPKGEGSSTESCDVLYDIQKERLEWFGAERIDTQNTHGTGCTFSSAIATFLAFGHDLQGAVNEAKAYLTQAILLGKDYALGSGYGPVNHFGALFL